MCNKTNKVDAKIPDNNNSEKGNELTLGILDPTELAKSLRENGNRLMKALEDIFNPK